MQWVLLPLLLSATLAAWTPENWTCADTIRECVWQGINLVDWAQTKRFEHSDPNGNYCPESYKYYYERNPVLGKHPSQHRINNLIFLAAVAHVGVSVTLPPKWRRRFQSVTIVCSAAAVANNYDIGIRIKF